MWAGKDLGCTAQIHRVKSLSDAIAALGRAGKMPDAVSDEMLSRTPPSGTGDCVCCNPAARSSLFC